MARHVGAELLAEVDRLEAAGQIDATEAEARRIRVRGMIAAGKDVENSKGENIGFTVAGVTLILVGLVAAALMRTIGGLAIAGFLLVCGVLALRRRT